MESLDDYKHKHMSLLRNHCKLANVRVWPLHGQASHATATKQYGIEVRENIIAVYTTGYQV
jgi:hypothetical protein